MEQGETSKNYEALTLGQRAGQLGFGAGLNPYEPGTAANAEWERARSTAIAARIERPLHPFCRTCGWRQGGLDSWDGNRCKCGLSAPAQPRAA